MAILATTDFQGRYAIGGLGQTPVDANVQWFIDYYEPLFLAKLLGVSLAELLEAAYPEPAPNPEPDDRYKKLAKRVKPMLLAYVYVQFTNDSITKSTGTGTKSPKAVNADAVSPVFKLTDVFNEMVSSNWLFRNDSNFLSAYPEYDNRFVEPYRRKGGFCIPFFDYYSGDNGNTFEQSRNELFCYLNSLGV